MKLITLSLFIFSTLGLANRLDLEKYIKLSIKNNPAFAEVDVDKEALITSLIRGYHQESLS